MEADLVLIFQSSNHAIAAEYFCKENCIEMELIPTPREISSNCGFSLLIHRNNATDIKRIFTENQVLFSRIFQIKIQNGDTYYEENN